jgi:hypothetical protein
MDNSYRQVFGRMRLKLSQINLSQTLIKHLFLTKAFSSSKLSDKAQIFTDEISFKNQKYIAIYMTVLPMDWRYYRLVPIESNFSAVK